MRLFLSEGELKPCQLFAPWIKDNACPAESDVRGQAKWRQSNIVICLTKYFDGNIVRAFKNNIHPVSFGSGRRI